ncbi:Tn7-like element transposition protein TnsE [uncultured Psychrobacter sp.]|uniref:Tn7-like element transposition protein TnsE n=1 Tax=uncultured Psychrobacter sp. TaxID=259303 RepID=UPI0025958508|nr:Tn7-like element transposition protein TnsE [uncultured Psychrobacter sp.]
MQHFVDDITIKYHELPKVKYCRRYRSKSGLPRTMMEARFQYTNQGFLLFEVYTADIDTHLSTLIVKVDSYNQLERKMSEFMKKVVKGSSSWTDVAALFDDSNTLHHPIGFYEKEFNERMIQKWLSGLQKNCSYSLKTRVTPKQVSYGWGDCHIS